MALLTRPRFAAERPGRRDRRLRGLLREDQSLQIKSSAACRRRGDQVRFANRPGRAACKLRRGIRSRARTPGRGAERLRREGAASRKARTRDADGSVDDDGLQVSAGLRDEGVVVIKRPADLDMAVRR